MGDHRYRAIFARFMSMKDGVSYTADKTFSTEELLLVTPIDVCRWLNRRAYDEESPPDNAKPIHARSTTLEFDKKAISSFMPRRTLPWDPISCHGNPTRAEEVNKIIKAVKKSEVRREGVQSNARRPIEFTEFLNLLSIVAVNPNTSKYMVSSVLTLQWHLIARIDDMMKLRFADFSPNIHHPSTLICQMRWSKNILEERDAPEQVVFGSADPHLCPLLKLAIHIESTPGIANSEFLYGNPKDGDRVVRRALQQALDSDSFTKLKSGHVGTHSLRKGAATYGSRSGLTKDYVNRRGRWRTRKSMVDTYIDNTQPYPDACAAAAYVSAGGNLSVNPVEREQFHVVGDGSEMHLIAIGSETNDIQPDVEHSNMPTTTTVQYDRRQFAALHAEIFSLKRYMNDVMHEILCCPSSAHNASERTSTYSQHGQEQDGSKRPKDLFELWQEFEFGSGGRKAAKNFAAAERGANKFAYSRRKVFWDTVANLVRAGYTSDVVIDKVYVVYGRQLSVSSILTHMRANRQRGGHPALRM
ncbi:hypothetical protein AC1031_017595 [Aphanomyces cochlioides]|nr:hypothetical protein AC1031_017595 [Aphanomyces cochlioides]